MTEPKVQVLAKRSRLRSVWLAIVRRIVNIGK